MLGGLGRWLEFFFDIAPFLTLGLGEAESVSILFLFACVLISNACYFCLSCALARVIVNCFLVAIYV